jgi:hypothetical protein
LSDDEGDIPIIATYRGVGLHFQQSEARLVRVRADIDAVMREDRIVPLEAWCGDPRHAPESRVLAFFKLSIMAKKTSHGRGQPGPDLEVAEAGIAGLHRLEWRHPEFFCSMLCHNLPGFDQAVPREIPLPWGYKPNSLEDAS